MRFLEKKNIKIKIKRIGPFEKAGYPVALFNKEEEEAREREGSKPFGIYRSFRRREGESEEAATARRRKKRKKKKKKKRDLNYFPKGFKSENLSETSLFSISRGKVTLRDIKPHEGVHFGRLDARESLREIRNIARR